MNPDLRTLRGLVWSQGRRYFAAVLAEGLATLFLFTTPWLSMLALDQLAQSSEPGRAPGSANVWGIDAFSHWLEGASTSDTLWRIAAAIAVASAIAGLLLFARVWWSSNASERIVRALRDRLYGHIERLPMSWHDAAETGDIVQRCSSDVETVRLFLSSQIVEIGRAVILLSLLVPALLALDVWMTVTSLVLLPFILSFALYYFKVVRKQFQEMDEAEGCMTSVLQENLTGIRVVRAFARQEYECEKFATASRDFRSKNRRFVNALATFVCISDLLCFTQLALVVLVGAGRIQAETLTVGAYFAIFSYVWIAIWPVRHMGRVLADAGKATVAMQRIGEVLAASPEPEVHGELESLGGRVEFEGVSFSYGSSTEEAPTVPILRNVSFTLKEGQTLALVGPPGAGKTTLVRVLTKLYEGYEGSIRLDGKELRDLSHAQIRRSIACVLQQPFVFAKTVEANLGLGVEEPTLAALEPAARNAALHDSIVEFQDGYQTLLGERGVTLSGGQRGRLAIARALAKEAPILILDDSLSAVDSKTEEQILTALRTRDGERTKILIAHRISTLREADLILVLEQGSVVESGTHAELCEARGHYARLVRLQGSEYVSQES